MPDLSILICSLHSRFELRERLLYQIAQQPAELLARCQVLVDIDNGAVTIGEKRNRLLDASSGRYIVFIDDDDTITANYLTRIFEGIVLEVDHIGVGMMYMPRFGKPHLVECSMHHEWGHDGTKYLRSPQHTCAVKWNLACKARFPEISFGEDKAYAQALKALVKTEYVITEPVYEYRFVEGK